MAGTGRKHPGNERSHVDGADTVAPFGANQARQNHLRPAARPAQVTPAGYWSKAAWHYRRAPRIGPPLKNRQHDQPAALIAIARKAQQRLHRILAAPGRPARQTQDAVVVARHLVGFCWSLVNTDTNEHPTT